MADYERSYLERGPETGPGWLTYASESGSVCLVGGCLTSPSAFSSIAETMLRDNQPDMVQGLPGNYTVIVKRGEKCAVNVDPPGQFPVFWLGEGDSLRLATDARSLGSRPNPEFLGAMILRCPELVSGQSALRGVHKIEGGRTAYFENGHLEQLKESGVQLDSSLTFEEAAHNLRHALIEAIELRLALGKIVTSDCSGGFDSTTLALLAAERSGRGLDAFIQYMPGTIAGDVRFARAVAQENQRLRLHELQEDTSVLPFQGLGQFPCYDEPDAGPSINARLLSRLTAAKEYGSELHMFGEAGDAILDWPWEVLADLARHGKTERLQQACRAYARAYKLNPAELLEDAVNAARRTLAMDLTDAARMLRAPELAEDLSRSHFRWLHRFDNSLSFLTASMRRRLSEACELQAATRTISEDIGLGDYTSLKEVQSGALGQRHTLPLTRHLPNLELHAPYLDRSVVTACLQLPAHKRGRPGEFKPILRAALPDVIPDILVNRRTKGTYTDVAYKGLREVMPFVRSLFEQKSRLAALDVIEPRAVLEELEKFDMGMIGALPNIEGIIAAELWLRQLEGA